MTAHSRAGISGGVEHLSVASLLEALEAPAPSPSGGSAAALAGAMAASLVVLVGRRSASWPEAAGVTAQACSLRARLIDLADEDVRAYAAALEALAAARESGGARDHLLGVALEGAADVPLRITGACADVAKLGALAAASGKPPLRPDATTAALLAEAACRSAARLVEVNLATLPGDARRAEALACAAEAALAREHALAETA